MVNRVKKGANPYLDEAKDHGRKSERRVSASLAGELRLNSGAIATLKGDFSGEVGKVDPTVDFLYEAKSTVHRSLGVKKEWLDKITDEALSEGKIPALTISFVDEDGRAVDPNSDWVAIPAWWWKEHTGGNSG